MTTNVRDGAEKMLAAVRGLPGQFSRGIELAGEIGRGASGVRRLVVSGMGGSAFPAEVLRAYAEPLGVEVLVSREYAVRPSWLGPESLVLACSFSGDTEETLAAFDDALSHDARVFAVSAGGELERRARARGVPHVRLERPWAGFQPRAATGYFVGVLAAVAEDAGLLPNAREDVRALGRFLETRADAESRAEPVVQALRGRIPVVYATRPHVDATARIIKIKLNENAKIPAFFYGLPELNHNEMVGFTRLPGPFAAIFLRDPELAPALARRLSVTMATLRDAGLTVIEVPLVAGPVLHQIFDALYLFDFVSVGLAVADGIDPNPVDMVEAFKRRLVAE